MSRPALAALAALAFTTAGCAKPPTVYKADEAAASGLAEIRIASVAIKPNLFTDQASANPKDKHLSVKLLVVNTSKTRKWHFDGWSGTRNVPHLEDDLGNRDEAQAFGGDDGGGDLYPGQSAACEVSFPRPVPGATRLLLRLPARDAIPEAAEVVTFAIPMNIVQEGK